MISTKICKYKLKCFYIYIYIYCFFIYIYIYIYIHIYIYYTYLFILCFLQVRCHTCRWRPPRVSYPRRAYPTYAPTFLALHSVPSQCELRLMSHGTWTQPQRAAVWNLLYFKACDEDFCGLAKCTLYNYIMYIYIYWIECGNVYTYK